ncbi:hypothetical protein Metfor_1922 [Methanoregula formicica SMSP]|uniref:Uncharacterized protein n=1 Tax=Methanoregula formicica (strain DSM 22288 / NBRC 105244 / SMSP) TaxID=593750 RepID=L0HFY6_METFS|nr:hypothetical protein Metfor_1922 [Methanoregula formicica SMSP]
MKKNHLIIFTIVCGILVIYGAISFQWVMTCSIIAFFILFLIADYLIETLSSIRLNLEKIEQHLNKKT